MELVGPDAKECTGKSRAFSASVTVPSFCVRNSGASMPLSASACTKASVVLCARSISVAFSSATFSRPKRPMRPSWCE